MDIYLLLWMMVLLHYRNELLQLMEFIFLTQWDELWEKWLRSTQEEEEPETEESKDPPVPPLIPRYEDKYLEDIRKLNKEWVFTEEDLQLQSQMYQTFVKEEKTALQLQLNRCMQEMKLLEHECMDDRDMVVWKDGTAELQEELKEMQLDRKEQMDLLQEECANIQHALETRTKYEEAAQLQAKAYIIQQKIDKLKHNFVMEKTPLGNVLMLYDPVRESFTYYADSTIPYRYLETVGRKYVKLFQCRPLFVDMEEELKLVEEKWTKEYELKKAKELEEKKKEQQPKQEKKSVFAKFKSYNKDVGKIGMAAVPPKNNIPNNTAYTKENEKILLKEKANRYTYEGKLANFNFLQKVEKKVFNKKLGLSFSEFKKLQKKE